MTYTYVRHFVFFVLTCLSPYSLAQTCSPAAIDALYPTTTPAGDSFGFSIAIDGHYAVVGTPDDDRSGQNSGSVSVYRQLEDLNKWELVQVLESEDLADGDLFGNSVAIDGNLIVIGAPGDDDRGSRSGSAYVFELQGIIWRQVIKLTASNGSIADFFGGSVAIGDGILVVGAERNDDMGTNAGAVYLISQEGMQYTEEAILYASDAQAYSSFGNQVAISDDTVLIGAPEHSDAGNASGAAYIFTHNGTIWQQQAKLVPQDIAANDQFGASVGIHFNQIVAGAPYHDISGPNAGAAYVYRRYGSQWSQQQKLLPQSPQQNASFGADVAMSSDRILIGEPGWDASVQDLGAVSLYTYNGVQWDSQPRLTPINQADANFGTALAIRDDMILIGAFGDGFVAPGAGVVYVNIAQCEGGSCPADLNQDGMLDFFDVSQFLMLYGQGDPGADFNSDGNLDFFDVSQFLQAYLAGCP